MKSLGIIPARAGSKGVPKKNIRILGGKPLIGWTIEEAHRASRLDRVIVSTDSTEIARIAESFGAEVPFIRPSNLAEDNSTDVDVLTHALDYLQEAEGYVPDFVVRLPPTASFRRAEHIDEGVCILRNTPAADALRVITEAPLHPYKMWRVDGAFLEPFLSASFTGIFEPYNLPRQMLPQVFVQSGAMDVVRHKTLRELKSTSGSKLAFLVMKVEDSIDIDSELDFATAEAIISRRLETKA